ncbi:hypothetical protein L6452_06043 [Arctium lappa]|uniref:Uncharacterized protein n=1 Tax=Arctium lappa TaxID=4217 RepID=A0ACB9EII8_ARCLA|nr:hypothetical protein L6452_06043 [Arctium lappa]
MVALLLVFVINCAARPAKEISPATVQHLKVVEEKYEGEGKDEWLMKKTIDEAHLDYIYTQDQPNSNHDHP